jgi:hypothetical protein
MFEVIMAHMTVVRALRLKLWSALEAGNLAFIMAREIQERVGSEMRVLNSAKLPFIRNAPISFMDNHILTSGNNESRIVCRDVGYFFNEATLILDNTPYMVYYVL